MTKDRLFVFGDSWAFNYFSKTNKAYPDAKPFFGLTHVETFVNYYNNFGHWLDYMDLFFDVYSYGRGGVSNEEITWQLSYLPEYRIGDRMIIMFTGVERYTWVDKNRRYTFAMGSPYPDLILDRKYVNFFKQQYIEKYEYWMNDTIINPEKNFLNVFPTYFQQYKPICVTWRNELAEKVESIDLLDFNNYNLSTITDETNQTYVDGHLGAIGNYELFKYFAKKLNLDISNNSVTIKKFQKEFF